MTIFDLNFLCINKKYRKNTDVVTYEIKYITTQNIDIQNINNKLPLCISDVRAYIIEENKYKYLIFALTQNNKKMLNMSKNFGVKL